MRSLLSAMTVLATEVGADSPESAAADAAALDFARPLPLDSYAVMEQTNDGER